jgi:hypothetical protein
MSARRKFNLKRDLLLLKQRIDSQSVFVYNGGMFKANEHLVAYAHTVKNNSYVLDSNTTPVYIEDAKDFVQKVTQKHYEITNEYADEYKKITT